MEPARQDCSGGDKADVGRLCNSLKDYKQARAFDAFASRLRHPCASRAIVGELSAVCLSAVDETPSPSLHAFELNT